MYTLRTEHTFDSAHFLAGYEGKCSNIHGHEWRVVIEIGSESLTEDGTTRGMIVDFGELKAKTRAEADALDHALIIEKGSLKPATMVALLAEDFKIIEMPFRPTAENFSKYFYDRMKSFGYHVISATVYETPLNCATYRE